MSESINSNGSGTAMLAARFEYDPFGNLTAGTSANAATFPNRFSTQPRDPVTNLLYYGYRWYDPLTGRWPSRDPIGERGGVNVYGFVRNDGVGRYDAIGLMDEDAWRDNQSEKSGRAIEEQRERDQRRARTKPSIVPDGEGGWFSAYSEFWGWTDLELLNLLWNTPGEDRTNWERPRRTDRIIRNRAIKRGEAGYVHQTFDGSSWVVEIPDESPNCYCLRVHIWHVVWDVSINKRLPNGIRPYEAVAHELAHIRSFAARLFRLAKEESAKPHCFETEAEARAALKTMEETTLPGYKSEFNDLDVGHDPRDWDVLGTPPEGVPVPWEGPTPEDAYGE